MRAGGNLGGLGDDSGGMNAGCVAGRFVEEFDGLRKRKVGILGSQGSERGDVRVAFDRNAFFNKDSRGFCRFQQGRIAAVCEEGDLALRGAVYAGNASDFDAAIPFQSAIKLVSYFLQFHLSPPSQCKISSKSQTF